MVYVFLYNVDWPEGQSGVNIFEYFGKLLCFVFKKCGCNPFIFFLGIFFDVILVRYNVILFIFVLWIYLFGIGYVVV